MKKLEDEGADTKVIQALASKIPQQNSEELEECPTCLRKFNPSKINTAIIVFIAAAARHIPKCKDIINKPKPPPRLRNAEVIQSISSSSSIKPTD